MAREDLIPHMYRETRCCVGMIDVSGKPSVVRTAIATGKLFLKKETLSLIRLGGVEKGNPVEVATVAGTMAVKRTWDILPLCHQIPLDSIKFGIRVEDDCVVVTCHVKAVHRTGVEMEALVGVSVALLTIWDMVKQYEKDERGEYPSTRISDIVITEKRKGVTQ